MRQFSRKFPVYFSAAKLWRFRRNEYRLQRFLWIRLEQVTELLPHFFRVHIADNDEDEIVRYVTGLIILHHLLLRKLVINLQLADDWKPVGMALLSSCTMTVSPFGEIHFCVVLSGNAIRAEGSGDAAFKLTMGNNRAAVRKLATGMLYIIGTFDW